MPVLRRDLRMDRLPAPVNAPGLLQFLDRRARRYIRRNGGSSPYLVGSIEDPYRLREQAPQLRPHINTVLAQPGLSANACNDERLRLLAGAQSYVPGSHQWGLHRVLQ